MKNVLVTGGCGFIGSHLVRKLLHDGVSVTILDNLSNSDMSRIADLLKHITFIRGDIRDEKLIESLIPQFDTVFHLAAMISVVESLKKPKECFEINTIASHHIATLCAKHRVSFLFSSSAAVYGNQPERLIHEGLSPRPLSPYGESKLRVEEFCKTLPSHFHYTCLRNFNVYGELNVSSGYAAVIPKFFEAAYKKKPLIIYGDGSQTRDFIHVLDVVNAFLISATKKIRGIFNIGSGKETSIAYLAHLILDETQSSAKILQKKARAGEVQFSRASITRFTQKTGWKPYISLEAGIRALSCKRPTYISKINPKTTVAIGIPAYNEANRIGSVIDAIQSQGFDTIIVADDCSKDETGVIARKHGATVLRHVINRGAGGATATLIGYAKQQNFDFLVLLDADGQHNPRDILALLLFAQNKDVVIGSRNVDDKTMPLVRRIANKVGSFITWFFFGLFVTDSQSGFKIFNKKAIHTIQITYDRFEFCSEIIGEIHSKKLSYIEYPIQVIYTDESVKKGQTILNGFRMVYRFLLRN